MNALIAAALSRSRTVLSLLVFFVLWGTIAYINIPKESTPDVKIPLIYVSLIHPGISPQDAQRLLLRPLEQELHNIEGIKEMRSTAFEGGGNVVLEFFAGFNPEKARYDVRDRVDIAKVKLPSDTKEPVITEINLSQFPILVVKLSGQIPQRTLYKMGRTLRDKIESTLSSVSKVKIVGDQEDAVEILVDPTRVESYGISFDQLIAGFTQNNQLISAGTMDTGTGNFSIKVPGVLESLFDIRELPLVSKDDAIVRLKDVAEVRRSFKDRLSIARDWGKTAVALEISKRTGENLIQTIEDVKALVATYKKNWPDHVVVSYANDQSHHIRHMLSDLQNNLILAVLIVMAIIIISLGWRSSLLVGVAVPGSFLMGIMIISLMGLTVNIVVLFSLIFAVGMLVDGAIIVVEYADREIAQGVGSREAYLKASQRMAWPVITSTITIIAVFMPLLFWPGVPGQFMKYMPITLIAVMSASILMALIFVPTIGQWIRPKVGDLVAHEDDHGGWLTEAYKKVLIFALDYPKRIIGGAILILILVKLTHSFLGRGIEFFPNIEPDIAAMQVRARGNLSLVEKDDLVRLVEAKILALKELKTVYTHTGVQEGLGEDVIGTVTVEFIDWQKRRPVDVILIDIEKEMKTIPGILVDVVKQKDGPPGQKPIEIELTASNSALLKPALMSLRKYLESLPEVTSISDNAPIPGLEWQITIDRAQAAKFEANVQQVGNAIKLVTNGIRVGSFRPEDARDEVDIVVRYFPQYRTLDELDTLKVQTTMGMMPISNFVTRKAEPKVGKIERVNGSQVATLKADVIPGALVSDQVTRIREMIPTLKIDPDVNVIFKGEDKDQKESMIFLMKAFLVAIFMIALILITQFNSFFSAALVLSAVMMSSVGVFIGLMVHGLAFGIVMGGIGVIALAGIIVSNNIILIDTYDLLMKNLKNPTLAQVRDVIQRTCLQRLRPVILTKLTAILGLLPIMLGVTIDFIKPELTIGAPSTQWWRLLSTCIVYGLLFASPLTLLVTPAALMWRAKRRYK